MFDSGLHEECGVAAVWNLHSYNKSSEDFSETSRTLFYALFALQHRGQEAAGIAVSNGKNIHAQKNAGLVSAAFTEADMARLQGYIHVTRQLALQQSKIFSHFALKRSMARLLWHTTVIS